MSRKQFKAVAELLRDYRERVSDETFNDLVHGFIDLFLEENPKFNPEKFVSAVWR